jgi:hypothetical protein
VAGLAQPGDDMSHTVTYRIHSVDLPDPLRRIEVPASPEALRQFVEQGFLVRERLRAAAEEIAAAHGGEAAERLLSAQMR